MKSTEKQRTIQQNRALHLFFRLLAEELNKSGKDLKVILSKFPVDIPATETNIKEDVWRPIQEAALGKKSTTKLTTQDIDKIYDVICRWLAEQKITCPPFPSWEEQMYQEK